VPIKTLKEEDLEYFTGSETWYRHGLVRAITYTDGAKYVADAGGAYWLLDEIVLAQKFDAKVRTEPFQVWKLAVSDGKGVLSCDDGNGSFLPEWMIVKRVAARALVQRGLQDDADDWGNT
jgi:hypothetical protein